MFGDREVMPRVRGVSQNEACRLNFLYDLFQDLRNLARFLSLSEGSSVASAMVTSFRDKGPTAAAF